MRNAAKISCARCDVGVLPLGELLDHQLVAARGAGLHRLLAGGRAAARPARSTGRRAARGTASSARVSCVAVERLVERCLGLLLGHRPPAAQPDAGEEDLLVQAHAAATDQHHPRDRGDERLRQVVDDDRGDPVQRRVDAPQRAAQQPLRLLHDRMAEVDVDQVAAAFGDRRRRT